MSRSASDRTAARLFGAAVVALAVMPLPGALHAQAVEGSNRIVSSEISVSRREATLKLELTGGQRIDIAVRDGRVFSGGRELGEAQRGGALDRAWRDLLNEAIDAPTDQLARMLVGWEAPGGEVGRRVDAMLESALTGVDASAEVVVESVEAEGQTFASPTSDSVNRLVERITQLERLVDELEDAPAPQVRVERADRSSGSWLGPFRHVVRGIAGILSILVTYAVIFGIGLATIFFGGRRYIEGVADTARRATMRSLLVGLAATFLVIPAFILGIIALAISIVGIPALLVWIPLFPVAAGLAVLLGYLGVAHAAGEALAERRFYTTDWFERGNSYYFLMTGLGLLMSLFIASQVVAMAGPWLGFFRGALVALGVCVTWAALSVGLGAVLLSRGGARPVRTLSGPDPEIYAEETHV